MSITLRPVNLQQVEQAYTGALYVSPATLHALCPYPPPHFATVKVPSHSSLFYFALQASSQFKDDTVGIGKFARQILKITIQDLLTPTPFKFEEISKNLSVAEFEITLEQGDGGLLELGNIQQVIRKMKTVPFQVGQMYIADIEGQVISLKVKKAEPLELGSKKIQHRDVGFVDNNTELVIKVKEGTKLQISGQTKQVNSLFKQDFKFEDIGIGGLDAQLTNIFRSAFASRRFPEHELKKYGIKHVKGILLYGPPGTGKTLIARKLSQALNCTEPKIVNGPSLMSKFVGESEKNIRELFEPAIAEYRVAKENSSLHVIIFDEIDAVCRQRGSVAGGTNVHDTMVNQLLSMIDGVEAVNNVLVIGMTNRKDLIDEALLRPGRFETHVEIPLPNEAGRLNIFEIHTENMRKNNLLGSDVKLQDLAQRTKNYTGAEIEGLVKNATSYLFNRASQLMDFSKNATIDANDRIWKADFDQAIIHTKPQFGPDSKHIEAILKNPLIPYGEKHDGYLHLLQKYIDKTTKSQESLHTILLLGRQGCGKTSLSAWCAKQTQFPFIKFISPDQFVGYPENQKLQQLVKIFEDAYKSPLSCIILDNIERMIEFIDMGPRFSNTLLQAILVLVQKVPQNGNKLMIIGTCEDSSMIWDLEIAKVFDIRVKVQLLTTQQEKEAVLKSRNVKNAGEIARQIEDISVKKLLMVIDLVQSNYPSPTSNDYLQTMKEVQL